ncbi:diaminopimelate decarboxylase family protein [Photorhabdus tasmaniensis]|uniref:diaminopimelate decarboxylase family protein n=1 Tax=Photorhabdus tasmaniensis TaxID=1004159 RepID=UPI0040433584
MLNEYEIRDQTPLFVYDSTEIEKRAKELIVKLNHKGIYYSVKANSNLQVLGTIARIRGIEAEICSIGELRNCIKSGFEPKEMVYGGPGKTKNDIELAISLGIRKISIESLNELYLVKTAEKSKRISIKKIIRVLLEKRNISKLSMMKPDSKFGILQNEIEENKEEFDNIYGFHLYFGTQCSEENVFYQHVNAINEIVLNLERILGYQVEYINYGGGLAWPYLVNGSASIADNSVPDTLSRKNIFFEFGRYLVASSGVLYTEVLDVKRREEKQIVILDAGVHTIAGINATGRLLKPKLDYSHFSKNKKEEFIETAVFGPLCTPADYLTLSAKLPRVDVGDIVCIPNAGAYGFATGMQKFLLRKLPMEKMVNG